MYPAPSRLVLRLGTLAAVGALAVGQLQAPPGIATATPTIGQLIGQKLMVAMSGTTPRCVVSPFGRTIRAFG